MKGFRMRAGFALALTALFVIWPAGSRAIVGGTTAIAQNYPYQAFIIVGRSGTSIKKCGGAIIDTLWVLTAARCFHNAQGQPYTSTEDVAVFSGGAEIGTNMTSSTLSQIVLHPNYNFQTDENDL